MTNPAALDGDGPAADRRLVRSTARRIGAQAAALVAATVLVLAGLTGVLVIRQQHAAAGQTLQTATARVDDVEDPPAGSWLVLAAADGTVTATPGLPRGLPDLGAIAAVRSSGAVWQRDERVAGREYRLRTVRLPTGEVVQAALDLHEPHAEQARLVLALLAVGSIGLVLAGVVGAVLGHRAVRPLADALARQREFVADASHELRTPLTLLSTRVQLLQRRTRTAVGPDRVELAALTADVDAVARDTTRMVALVEDLLLAVDPREYDADGPVDVSVLGQEVVESASDYAAERGVRLRLAAGPPPAGAGRPLTVGGTGPALRRALLSVLDNALEHTPSGGDVTMSISVVGAFAVIEVRDAGAGIALPDHDRVFDRFRSGHQKSGRRSYGLGLSLARAVVERHGGRLEVAATGPGGTTFQFRLPLLDQGAGTRAGRAGGMLD